MARWQQGTGQRMRDAALRLFTERGYDRTTVEQIAEAAGVTERTFFRHFPDKEEVLFDEDAALLALLQEGLGDALAAPPVATDPTTATRAAVRRLAQHFDGDHARHRMRARVLADVPALEARQLLKQDRWSASLVGELRSTGVEARTAAVAVAVAVAGLRLAYGEWVGRARPGSLGALLDAYEAAIDRSTDGAGRVTSAP
jgi:AcrR family transcriptional regulator